MTLLQAPEFKYSPLPTPTSVRLLRIHRTRGGVLPSLCGYPLIHLSLHVVDLSSDSAPAYEALSYTWDSPEAEHHKRENDTWKDPYGPLCSWPVAVRNGATGEQGVSYVRKNLFDALLHLQSMNDIDERQYEFGKTWLHIAAEKGDTDDVRIVLDEGASCGARDVFGETPLHYAAENGHYEVVKLLVASGADMNVYDDKGRTPVQCCVQRKRRAWEKTARFLRDLDFRSQELRSVNLDDGEDLEARSTPFLKTPLIQAAEDGDLARVRELIRRGANLSAQAKYGKTALHHGAGNGYYDIVKQLVRAGANLDILDAEKRTPVVCCEQMKQREWKEISRFLKDRTFRQEELSRLAASDDDGQPNSKRSVSRFFWIDALCINQADLEERGAQVRIMPQIYTKADCVIVWLGDDSQMLFRLLRNVWRRPNLKAVIGDVNRKARRLKELEEQWLVSLQAFLIDKNVDWAMPEGGLLTINNTRLILSTFLRAWFTRVWCIQELSLARNIRMFIGKTELEWREILKFLCLMAHVGFFRPSSFWKMDSGWTMKDGKGGDGSEAWRLAEIRLRTADISDEWAIVDPIFHRKHCKAPHIRRADRLSLPLLLAATWSFESKDPRDKIYAILSLAAPLPPEDKIVINYTSPVEDLYTQVAYIFLRGSGRDSMYIRGNALAGILEPLEGLSYVQDPYYSGQQARMPGLPTWAPDFSNPLTTDRIWSRGFSAAKSLDPVFGPRGGDDKETLQVHGVEVDVVDMVEPGWANMDPDDMPPDLEVDVESWFNLLETMTPNKDELPVQTLFRTLCVDKLWTDCDEETKNQNAASFREFLAWELARSVWVAHATIQKEKQREEEQAKAAEQPRPSDAETHTQPEEDPSEPDADSEANLSEEGSGWECNECERELVAGDWHCADCEDFDYCWQCYRDAKTTHDSSHRFLMYQVAPSGDDDIPRELEKAPTTDRLVRMFQARSTESKQSLLLAHQRVEKSFSKLKVGSWFGNDSQDSDQDSKSTPDSVTESEDTPPATETNVNDEVKLASTARSPEGLKDPLWDALNHQRALEQAQIGPDSKRRFLPTDGEIPDRTKLANSWQWCKYHGDETKCKTLDDETSFRYQLARVYRKRCLFKTKAGRLGLGPQSVKAGDSVCLLAGTRTPYVLRKGDGCDQVTDANFSFLGEAYVDGIMHGEAASELTQEGLSKMNLM